MEHLQTKQDLNNKEIHANHIEAFNASLRRRCAAYRRKTNTYAKQENRLQERLDVYWIVHNFIRLHFTTRTVPAVALGILAGIDMERTIFDSKNSLEGLNSLASNLTEPVPLQKNNYIL